MSWIYSHQVLAVLKKVNDVSGSDEPLTDEQFYIMMNKIGINLSDMENMTIAQCLDYVQEWIDLNSESENTGNRKATQADFDAF